MKKNLKRREFLKKAGVAGAAAVGASTLAAPAIAGVIKSGSFVVLLVKLVH